MEKHFSSAEVIFRQRPSYSEAPKPRLVEKPDRTDFSRAGLSAVAVGTADMIYDVSC